MVLWFGKKLCDRGFLINLKHREDRLERSIRELAKSRLEGIERFDALVIEEKNFIKYSCTKSHIEIAKIQIKNGWNYVMYLEDDIISDFFYDYMTDNSKINIEKVSEAIIENLYEKKPDILWLGVRPENYTKKISDCFLEPDSTLMSHAYIGSLRYAKFLVENLEYWNMESVAGGWPIDFFISQITKKNDWRI
jgi:GR25 family glycosyltransferase involved in LPS biosynthesis